MQMPTKNPTSLNIALPCPPRARNVHASAKLFHILCRGDRHSRCLSRLSHQVQTRTLSFSGSTSGLRLERTARNLAGERQRQPESWKDATPRQRGSKKVIYTVREYNSTPLRLKATVARSETSETRASTLLNKGMPEHEGLGEVTRRQGEENSGDSDIEIMGPVAVHGYSRASSENTYKRVGSTVGRSEGQSLSEANGMANGNIPVKNDTDQPTPVISMIGQCPQAITTLSSLSGNPILPPLSASSSDLEILDSQSIKPIPRAPLVPTTVNNHTSHGVAAQTSDTPPIHTAEPYLSDELRTSNTHPIHTSTPLGTSPASGRSSRPKPRSSKPSNFTASSTAYQKHVKLVSSRQTARFSKQGSAGAVVEDERPDSDDGDNRSATVLGTNVTTNADGASKQYSYKDYEPTATVVYTRNEEETNDLVAMLAPGPLGFDMEWKVIFARGQSPKERRVAVIQLADARGMILVIQVSAMTRFPGNLQAVIESPTTPKIGANILGDGKKLFRDFGIVAANLVELGALAVQADPEGNGTRPVAVGTLDASQVFSQGTEVSGRSDVATESGSHQSQPGDARPEAELVPVAKGGRKVVALSKVVKRYLNRELDKGKVRTSKWECKLTEHQLLYAANDAHCGLMAYNHLISLASAYNIVLDSKEYTASVPIEDYFPTGKGYKTFLDPTESTAYNDSSSGAMRYQYMRAYQCWKERGMDLEAMCKELSLKKDGNSLKPATVISYVIGALEANSKLPFDLEKLRELIQMDAGAWIRHRAWFMTIWAQAGTTSTSRAVASTMS